MSENRDPDLAVAKAEFEARFPESEWWYVTSEMDGTVSITIGRVADIDDIIIVRLPASATDAEALRAGMDEATRRLSERSGNSVG